MVHISKPFERKDFILGTKIQRIRRIYDPSAEGHRSRSNVQKLAKIYEMGHISEAISPTDFIPRHNPLGAFNDSSVDDLDLRLRSQFKVKFPLPKNGKN